MATVHLNPAGPVPRLSGGSPAVNPGMQNTTHTSNISQAHSYSLDIQANANTTYANILPTNNEHRGHHISSNYSITKHRCQLNNNYFFIN